MARQPQKTESELLYEAACEEWDRRQQAKMMEGALQNADQVREECQPLIGFVEKAWRILEPAIELKVGWAVRAMALHLEAIHNGDIKNLLTNVPPGTLKSLLTNVFFPAWEWGPKSKPHMRYVCTSYGLDLTNRDGGKFLRLVTSDWYKQLWPDFEITRFAVDNIENSKTGTRIGVPWKKSMGKRGNRFMFDDPHDLENAESDQQRSETVRLFKEGASSRLNDPETDSMIGIMQRLHAEDLSGYILANDPSYTHLMLPQEFEPERKCITYKRDGSVLFEDPRTKQDELLMPERFTRSYVDFRKSAKGIGAYAYAGQDQQRPAPRGGGMFQKTWFDGKYLEPWELERFNIIKTVWFFDLADTDLKALQKTGARTAGVKMAVTKDGDYIILHSKGFGLSGAKKNAEIKRIVAMDKPNVQIFFPQDPAAGGKVQGRAMIKLLAGRQVRTWKEKGDKVARAEPFSSQCEGGNVYILKHDGMAELLDELEGFPNGPRKDLVDACSGAFAQLLDKKKRKKRLGAVGGKVMEAEQEVEE